MVPESVRGLFTSGELTDERCAGLGLGSSAGAPMDTVEVTGWPTGEGHDWGLVLVAIHDDPSDDPLGTAPVSIWEDPVELAVPVHPSDRPEGGEVQLRFGQVDDDGDERWCDELHELQVDPLPPADPAFGLEARVDEVAGWLEVALAPEEFGTDELARMHPSDVPDGLAALYIGARLLRDPAGLDSLRSEMTADDREMADRLLTQAAMVSETRLPPESGDAFRERPSSSTVSPRPGQDGDDDRVVTGSAPATWVGSSAVPGAGHRQPLLMSRPSSGSPQLVLTTSGDDARCRSVDTDGLARSLGRQFSGEAMLSGSPEQLIDAALFFGGLPYIGRYGTPTVLTAWLTKLVAEYLAHTLPSTWVRTTVDHDPEVLFEDDVAGGEVEALELEFVSDGWDAGPILAELGLIAGGHGLTSSLQRYARATPTPGAPGTVEIGGDVFFQSLEAIEEAQAVNDLAAELFAWGVVTIVGLGIEDLDLADDLAVIESRCWIAQHHPAETDEAVQLSYDGAIDVGGAPSRFQAVDVGDGRVEASWNLPIGEHLLGGIVVADARDVSATFEASETVEVRPIEVVWEPERLRADPGETVALRLRVDNAHDGGVRFSDSLGTIDIDMEAGEETIVGYSVPEAWDGQDPIQLTAQSLADRGLRDPAHPAHGGERSGRAWIIDADVTGEIRPGRRCLDPGETIDLWVVDAVAGDDPIAVTWDATSGSIDADGRFTAPEGAGEVVVTATPEQDGSDEITARFDIGGCEVCSVDLQIDGMLGEPSSHRWSFSSASLTGVDADAGTITGLGFPGMAFSGSEGARDTGQMEAIWGVVDGTVYTGDVDVPQTRYPDERAPDGFVLERGPRPFHEVPSEPRRQSVSVTIDRWDASGIATDWPSIEAAISIEGPVFVGWDMELVGDPQQVDGYQPNAVIGTMSVELSGRFAPEVYEVANPRVISDLLDAELDLEAFPDTRGGFLWWHDREGGNFWCGGERPEVIESRPWPVWPDAQPFPREEYEDNIFGFREAGRLTPLEDGEFGTEER